MNINYQKIELIRQTLTSTAKEMRESAALGGGWGDGGASKMLSDFEVWLDGVNFALTGETNEYKEIIDKHTKDNDPEYQEFLRLKEKFNE